MAVPSPKERELVAFVATNVREMRVERGMTQEGLAERADIGRLYVHRIERGGANPSLRVLVRLADALGVTVERLLRRAGPPAPRPHGRPSK